MHNKHFDRDSITAMVIASLEDVLSQAEEPPTAPVSEETHLVGRSAVLDSLGMVTLVVDLEQRIEEEYGVSLTLADDRAMSQKHSPFLTVRSLTNYILGLIDEERQHVDA
jgi:acyl carrier protein